MYRVFVRYVLFKKQKQKAISKPTDITAKDSSLEPMHQNQNFVLNGDLLGPVRSTPQRKRSKATEWPGRNLLVRDFDVRAVIHTLPLQTIKR